MYKLVAFDLDGTLAPSKKDITADMVPLICSLIKNTKVAVTSGGSLKQFQEQFLKHLTCSKEEFKNLYILPTNGARLYSFNADWHKVYDESLNKLEKEKILNAFKEAFKKTNFVRDPNSEGEILEDRESQITFSGMGQLAKLEFKKKWDPNQSKRQEIVKELKSHIPEFEIGIGGTTSIDVTKMGINKAYGIKFMINLLGIKIEDGVYIGDALYTNGNDAIVKTTGIKTIQIEGPEETKEIIKSIISETNE